MDLSALKAVNSNDPAFCHFAGPDGMPLHTDEGEAVGVWMLGPDSDDLTKIMNRQTDRYLKQRVPGGGVSAASARANEIEVLAKAVTLSGKGWTGIAFDGETWPCDDEHAAQLFREVPLFREQAGRFVADRGNWLKVSPKT
ncbi:hypothetical protein [Brevundimonas sp. Root1279]|uniref:hypothetical protein n=1 Tax=Brevundimonas sp. Root1279 TaxID=1736443 RepID=UPI0006FE0B04|nr:hypothetical protein [Brevundimonas sp. Root1279]KQW79713.1 hypothetical protein ASC65_14285 [Brevundimonas sp. Root1279]